MGGTSDAHVVVLGAGFGGLTFCQAFRHPSARITCVDRQNHHLFQPLLYQVATAGLSAPDIAEPIRTILADHRNVSVRFDTVREVHLADREVVLDGGRLHYDYLVLALGGVTSYFGHPEWAECAPGLKTLDDALAIRRNVLLAFERAENEPDPVARQRLMTIAVVGGGPTGVELAGAFAELSRHVLRRDFRQIDPTQARIVLIEATPRILSHLPERLSTSARRHLERLGVEVLTSAPVKQMTHGRMELEGGMTIAADTMIWAAGVRAHPVTASLGVELDRAGRVKVNPDLSVPGHPEVFAIGDLALVLNPRGQPVPGVSPAAMQMARHVARIVTRELADLSRANSLAARPAFTYVDKGTMATIGRSAAVAKIGALELTGYLAWIGWLFVHLIFLIGFDNRLSVLLQWIYSYLTYKRGARIITGLDRPSNRGDSTQPDSCSDPASTSTKAK
ncbi:MAG: NAD(P)/FAD-dependent oxidoreductase [Verrucomicrobia bacterium]|nr:NAD(P)/FAD-dependent oxidoreductase [Verrucomicrobiota bacterium]